MSVLAFQQLPVTPDDGLPQAFSCTVGTADYQFGLYANLTVPEDDPLTTVYDFSGALQLVQPAAPVGYLVLRVARSGPGGVEVILLRKLVAEPDVVHYGAELAVMLTTAKIARGNLNGAGHYGSEIVIGVAQRWE